MITRASFLLAAALCASAQPVPPCGLAPIPAYPAEPAIPSVKVYETSDWKPAPCTTWSPSASATLVAAAARFRNPDGIEPLRHRIAEVSQMTGLLYWSTSRQKWQPLIVEAYALNAAGPTRRRNDFLPSDIATGASLHVHQEDNLLGPGAYEIRILNATADRLVLSTANTSTIRLFGMPLFQPADLQSVCFLDRDSKDLWRYYSLTRMTKNAGVLPIGGEPSLINRAVALFRYLAGIPANQEPPAAR